MTKSIIAAHRPLTSWLQDMTIVTACKEFIFFVVYYQYWSIIGDSRQCLQASANLNNPKSYKYDCSCIHVFPQFEMQFKAVNKVIAITLLFATVQALAASLGCRSPFITFVSRSKTNHDLFATTTGKNGNVS